MVFLSRIALIFLFGSLLPGCTSFFYQPLHQLVVNPSDLELKYETVRFDSSDGTMLAGWFFPARLEKGQKALGTVVQFHGNGENRSTHFMSLVWLVNHGYNFFAWDYRGYDGSEGVSTQEGVYRDGMAAIRWIKTRVKPNTPGEKDLIFYGQSLGGAVLARCLEDVKDRDRILAVVIDSSFWSYQAIARDALSRNWITWLLQPAGSAWISDRYTPESSFALISPIPLLVIHGKLDQVIPYRFGEKIFSLAQEPKTFWPIEDGRHIDSMVRHRGVYREKLLQWLGDQRKASLAKR